VLAHGAGSGPDVFDGWADAFPGVAVDAIDLQAGLDVGRASMEDYAEAVSAAARRQTAPTALLGWSLGGLAALMAAERVRPCCVVLVEASPPTEVQGVDADIEIVDGTFDPESAYGPFPPGRQARAESRRARAERKRGISVPSLPCSSLVVYGREFPDERGRRLAAVYSSAELEFAELDHWGLVLDPRVREAVARWLLDG
jgi:pimeloyl-ACP methyl ester carboxylesterase